MTQLLTALTVFAGCFSLVALFRLSRKAPPAAIRRRRFARVLLLRPVDAPGPLELENLNAPIDYPGELTHVVLSPFRPRLTSANTRWLASDPLSSNRKVGHLAYGLSVLQRTAETVVISVDADVRVDGALLSALVDGIRDGAAVVSAAPQPAVGQSLATRIVRGLLTQSHHSFQALDVMSLGPKAICGKVLALSAPAATELVKLHDCIGEDLELSTVMFNAGKTVTLAEVTAQVPQSPTLSMREVSQRFTRWMQVLRAHRPALFPSVPLLFAPTPVLMVLAAALGSLQLALALTFLVGARIALANQLDRRPGLRFEWLLAEMMLLWCWVNALWAGRSVTWRGRTFNLEQNGRMRVVTPNISESAS